MMSVVKIVGETTKEGLIFQVNLDRNSGILYTAQMKIIKIVPLLASFFLISSYAEVIKVACIGDSITLGAGVEDRERNNYPAQLQRILGSAYQVKNFGVSGSTMLRKGNWPWSNHSYGKDMARYQPDIVVIMLGTNDAKPVNWKYKKEFLPNTLTLIQSFKSLPSKPRILLCTPLPGLTGLASTPQNIPGKVIAEEVVPLVRQAAEQSHSELIDLFIEFSFFEEDLPSILPDKTHPGAKGAASIALRVADQIMVPRNIEFSVESQLKKEGVKVTKETFHGYDRFTFNLSTVDNAICVIVAPKSVIQGQPWIWRARFFGHQPALDQALLDRGYHLAYCDISNLFGSPKAVARWDKFYAFTQALGLSKKPILEGMSRGGLIVFNWAKANPKKVAAIYGDNPVCDIRSWPAKKSPGDWERCLNAWGKTEADMPDFKGNPIDGLEPLVKAHVPVFLPLGTKDQVVLLSENAHILAERYTKLGGSVTVWEKPNAGHHPHGLHPIFPLLRHLLYASGNPILPDLYQQASTQTFPLVDAPILQQRQQQLKQAKRILFLGDSITYGGDYVSFFTAWAEQQSFAPEASFVNMGLSSETVSGLSEKGHAGGTFPRPDLQERLGRVLSQYKPDLIFACYGMNCAIYKPFDAERFAAYQKGITKLKVEAEKAGAQVVFITPPYFDNHGKAGPFEYADVLRRYSHWLVSKRADGWDVIDLNTEMTARIKGAQVLDPAFSVQRDKIHPNPAGHRIMAQSLINYYTDPYSPTAEAIQQNVIDRERFNLTHQRMKILRDAWLSETKHKRPGVAKGLPLPEAEEKAARLSEKLKELACSRHS